MNVSVNDELTVLTNSKDMGKENVQQLCTYEQVLIRGLTRYLLIQVHVIASFVVVVIQENNVVLIVCICSTSGIIILQSTATNVM